MYYHLKMTQRQKRSISLPAELAVAIDVAAAAEQTSVSAWISGVVAHRLRLDLGRQGIAEWEHENGPLTADELAVGLARARSLLAKPVPRRKAS
jgi:hypothetical protein